MKNLTDPGYFPYYTAGAIYGINIIRNIPTRCLFDLLKKNGGNNG